jgi:2-polyprenyl-6-hydroxyphenyl methylase/3-demethylubiquinone-9 3-methyltransferase
MTAARINNAFYDELGERWYEDDAHPVALLRAETRERLAYAETVLERTLGPGPARILDLGCGGGLMAIPLAGGRRAVKGVDLSEGSLAVARSRAPVGLNVEFERGDIYRLDEPSGAYDAVLMMDVLEHLERPGAALKEAARVLRPEGVLIFHTFNRTWCSYLLAVKAIELLARDAPRNMHLYRMFIRPAELERMCADAKLQIRETCGIRPRFLSKAFWWTLLRRRVHADFAFTRARSVLVGYLGYAVKDAAA